MSPKCKPTAVYFYAQEYKLKNNLDISMGQAIEDVYLRWKAMTDDEKAPYQKQLFEWKMRNKGGKTLSIHSDSSFSSSTSSRVSHETKLENRQRHFEYKLNEMFARAKELLRNNINIHIEKLLNEYTIKNKKWHIIDFQTFCRCPSYDLNHHHYEPYYVLAEMGLVEYSLEHGIEKVFNGVNGVDELRERCYHTFIKPNAVPLGYRSFVQESVDLHGIPFGGLAQASQKTYADIYNEIIQFVNERDEIVDESTPLTVFCLTEDYEKTEFALQFLRDNLQMSHNYQVHPREIQIIGLEYLVKLMAEKADRNVTVESAKDFLLQNAHSYTKEAACLFHQEKDTLNHCSLSKAKRYCYLISEAICRFYGIQLTERHVPKFESNTTIVKKDDRKYFKQKNSMLTPSESFNSSSRGLTSETSSQIGEEEEIEHDPEEFPDLDSNTSEVSSLSEYFGQTLTTISTNMAKSTSTKVTTTTVSSNRVLVAQKFQNSLSKSTTTTNSTTRTISSIVGNNNNDETSSQVSSSTTDENYKENDEMSSCGYAKSTSTEKDSNNNNQLSDIIVCDEDNYYEENENEDNDSQSTVSDRTISDVTSRSSVSMFMNRQAISELSSQVRGRGRLLSRR